MWACLCVSVCIYVFVSVCARVFYKVESLYSKSWDQHKSRQREKKILSGNPDQDKQELKANNVSNPRVS